MAPLSKHRPRGCRVCISAGLIFLSLLRPDLRADEDRATAVATLASDQFKLWMDAVMAAYRQSAPEVQAKALEAWQTQNSERLAAIRSKAQQLSATAELRLAPPDMI